MLSLEQADGALALLAHQFAAPEKLIEMANELVGEQKLRATVLIDPPWPATGREAARAADAAPADYRKPAPRKAGQ